MSLWRRQNERTQGILNTLSLGLSATAIATCAIVSSSTVAQDSGWDVSGYLENRTFIRKDVGLSKFENTLQVEFGKTWQKDGLFSSFSLNGTLRARYEGVYDLNDDEFGKNAGGAIELESHMLGISTPHGMSVVPGGLPPGALPPSHILGFDLGSNPNEGMIVLGQPLHETNMGVSFGVPVRPCNVDPRGCIDGYMDDSLNDLRFGDFNNRLDFIRELYVDGTVPFDDGSSLGIRLGKQQIVWGRTDLFRVLDVINPVDYSRQNIYDELEDIRIPQWMLELEYRKGATETFDDLNFSVVWNFDKFRPSRLGQAGTPYVMLDAGSFFRGMNNCWENGCSVSNFVDGGIATDFGPGIIGIRQANLPKWSIDNSQIGAKIEGVYQGVGFSLNYLNYISQLPSLRGGITASNAFTGENNVWPYLIAFDIDFPRINLFGGSVDFYSDALKSVFRIEAAYTSGEEFANTNRPELYSESDVLRYVVGWDRDTFIPFLNGRKAFLLSAQVFGQHLLDHELVDTAGSLAGVPGFGQAGIPDWKDNWIGTLLIKGWYKQNTISPQVLAAYDVRANALTISPSVDWIISDKWRVVLAANFKVGTGAQEFDDCRTCNPFPPFTSTPLHANPLEAGSVGLGGLEPLGRFRSGPLGMAQREDELQISIRYRF